MYERGMETGMARAEMTEAEQRIEDVFRRELATIMKYPNPEARREDEIKLSNWYKAEHQKLIDARKREQSEQQRDADNIHVCERCTKKLPVRRGRPAKLCEDCR